MNHRIERFLDRAKSDATLNDNDLSGVEELLTIIDASIDEVSKVVDALPSAILDKNIRWLSYDDIEIISNRLKSIVHIDFRVFPRGFNSEFGPLVSSMAFELAKEDAELVASGTIRDMYSFNWFCAAFLGNAQFNIAGKADLHATLATYLPSNLDYSFKIAKSNLGNLFMKMYGTEIRGKKPMGCLIYLLAIPFALSLLLVLIIR